VIGPKDSATTWISAPSTIAATPPHHHGRRSSEPKNGTPLRSGPSAVRPVSRRCRAADSA
jgi:hypothetical protein